MDSGMIVSDCGSEDTVRIPAPNQRQLSTMMGEDNDHKVTESERAVGVASILNHRNYVMTESSPSIVECKEDDEGCKTLSWNKCGCKEHPSKYELTWSQNHRPLTPITTTDHYWKFHFLEEGHYLFQVSIGESRTSKPYAVIVPESPEFKVTVLTSKRILVDIAPARYADEYKIFILSSGPVFPIVTGEYMFEIDESKFKFEKGVKYGLTVRALCKGISSEPSRRKDFITGLERPREFKCDLDHGDPRRSLKCTWTNSHRMSEAKIQLRTFENKLLVEEKAVVSSWKYWGLRPNRKYELFLFPGDGEKFFDDESSLIRHAFTTAPAAPEKVEFRRYQDKKYLRFEVTSDYNGPFVLTVRNMSGQRIADTPKRYESKYFALDYTDHQNQVYSAEVQCKFGDYLTDATEATPLGGHKCLEFDVEHPTAQSVQRRENYDTPLKTVEKNKPTRPRTLSTKCLGSCETHRKVTRCASHPLKSQASNSVSPLTGLPRGSPRVHNQQDTKSGDKAPITNAKQSFQRRKDYGTSLRKSKSSKQLFSNKRSPNLHPDQGVNASDQSPTGRSTPELLEENEKSISSKQPLAREPSPELLREQDAITSSRDATGPSTPSIAEENDQSTSSEQLFTDDVSPGLPAEFDSITRNESYPGSTPEPLEENDIATDILVEKTYESYCANEYEAESLGKENETTEGDRSSGSDPEKRENEV